MPKSTDDATKPNGTPAQVKTLTPQPAQPAPQKLRTTGRDPWSGRSG